MPVPKRKQSRSRRNSRSANKGLHPSIPASCVTCQFPVAMHQVCKECGYYKGVKVLRTKGERMFERGKAREGQMAYARAESALAADAAPESK